jgi:hypothetical protein
LQRAYQKKCLKINRLISGTGHALLRARLKKGGKEDEKGTGK